MILKRQDPALNPSMACEELLIFFLQLILSSFNKSFKECLGIVGWACLGPLLPPEQASNCLFPVRVLNSSRFYLTSSSKEVCDFSAPRFKICVGPMQAWRFIFKEMILGCCTIETSIASAKRALGRLQGHAPDNHQEQRLQLQEVPESSC
eukprot:4356632-Amphidinium_carterae.1